MENTTLRKMSVYAMAIVSLLGVAFGRNYLLLSGNYYWWLILATVLDWFELLGAVTALVLVSVIKKENINKKICFIMAIVVLSFVCLNLIFDTVYARDVAYIFVAGIEIFLFIKFMRFNKVSKIVTEQSTPKANVDDLLKYKNLLDQGVITQDEYDKIKSDILK